MAATASACKASLIALTAASERIAARETGLKSAFDLVLDILYLQRDLFPKIREGVRVGGTFVGEVLLEDPDHPKRNPAFAMKPGELRNEFAGWKILYYSESAGPGKSHGTARIVARRG